MKDRHRKLLVLYLEEVYLFQDFSVGDQGHLLAKIYWESAEKLICLLILLLDLGILKVSPDLVKQSIWYLLSLLEFDKSIQFLLKLLVVII